MVGCLPHKFPIILMQLIEGRLLQLAAIEWRKDILICSSALNQNQKPFSQQYGRRVFINWGYIVMEKNSIQDIKRLSFSPAPFFLMDLGKSFSNKNSCHVRDS